MKTFSSNSNYLLLNILQMFYTLRSKELISLIHKQMDRSCDSFLSLLSEKLQIHLPRFEAEKPMILYFCVFYSFPYAFLNQQNFIHPYSFQLPSKNNINKHHDAHHMIYFVIYETYDYPWFKIIAQISIGRFLVVLPKKAPPFV